MRDWNDMERIWQYIYSKDQLQTFAEEVRSIDFLTYFGTSIPLMLNHSLLPYNSILTKLFKKYIVIVNIRWKCGRKAKVK